MGELGLSWVPCKIVIICFDFCVLLSADVTVPVDSFVKALPGLYVMVCIPTCSFLGECGRRIALASAS